VGEDLPSKLEALSSEYHHQTKKKKNSAAAFHPVYTAVRKEGYNISVLR
jgi:hypothetical protein